MTAQILAFPGQTATPVTPAEITAERYAQVAGNLIKASRKAGMDPMVLAGAVIVIIEAQEAAVEAATLASLPAQAPISAPRGYRGTNYREGVDVKDIAKMLRADIAAARKSGELILPAHAKVSVRIDRYSMGCSIDVVIGGLSAAELWVAPGTPVDYSRDYPYNGGRSELRTNAEAVLTSLMNSYKRDDSDTMTDYYSVNFSGHVTSVES